MRQGKEYLYIFATVLGPRGCHPLRMGTYFNGGNGVKADYVHVSSSASNF